MPTENDHYIRTMNKLTARLVKCPYFTSQSSLIFDTDTDPCVKKG